MGEQAPFGIRSASLGPREVRTMTFNKKHVVVTSLIAVVVVCFLLRLQNQGTEDPNCTQLAVHVLNTLSNASLTELQISQVQDRIARAKKESLQSAPALSAPALSAPALSAPAPRATHQQRAPKRSGKVVVDYDEIRAYDNSKIVEIMAFTIPGYEEYMSAPAGKEHYVLWAYMTKLLLDENPEVPYIDIGTRHVSSALALGIAGRPVRTFDLPDTGERIPAFRGKTEEEWQQQVTAAGVHITFCTESLINESAEWFAPVMKSPLIVLDTHHLPFTVPFERQFLWRLIALEYDGIVLLDDIHLNEEMERWWTELETDNNGHYVMHDLTAVGHASGTGMLDFSHRVEIVGAKK